MASYHIKIRITLFKDEYVFKHATFSGYPDDPKTAWNEIQADSMYLEFDKLDYLARDRLWFFKEAMEIKEGIEYWEASQ